MTSRQNMPNADSLGANLYSQQLDRLQLQRLRASRSAYEEQGLERAAEQAIFVEVAPPSRLLLDDEDPDFEVIEHQDCAPDMLDDYVIVESAPVERNLPAPDTLPIIDDPDYGTLTIITEYVASFF